MKDKVKCYECGQLIPQGEAVKQKERSGNAGGGGYGHQSGWGVGAGTWTGEDRSYWLCITCDRKKVERRRFWLLIILAICGVVGLITFAFKYFWNH